LRAYQYKTIIISGFMNKAIPKASSTSSDNPT
jgi:hypothetical protein